MARKNPLALIALGAAGAAAVLAASPGTYAWLRRSLKLGSDREQYETPEARTTAPVSEPAVAETSLADARLTLRARLQETGVVAADRPPEPARAAPSAAAEARARLRWKVEQAKEQLADEDRTDEIEPV